MLHQEGNKRLGEMSHGRKEERGRELRRRSVGKTELDGEAWLMDEELTWKSLRKKKKKKKKKKKGWRGIWGLDTSLG
jgi:hypothetical protein